MTATVSCACSAATPAPILSLLGSLLQRGRSNVWRSTFALYGWAALAPVWAQTGAATSISARDAQVLSRAITFFLPARTPNACFAVVFGAGDPNSRRDAEAVAGHFDNSAGTPRAIVVPSDGLGQATGCGALVAAAGAPVDAVMEAARQQRVPCVTASRLAVEAGRCTMWVKSEPRVEIVVNHNALVSGGLGLAAAFRMMIREL